MLVWKKKRLDRMLVDHCLRQGFYETAKKLSVDADIEVYATPNKRMFCKTLSA